MKPLSHRCHCVVALITTASRGYPGTSPVQFKKAPVQPRSKAFDQGRPDHRRAPCVRAGQTMQASMLATKHWCQLISPVAAARQQRRYGAGSLGSSGGNEWTGALPADGEYKARDVSDAQRAAANEAANYTLRSWHCGTSKPRVQQGPGQRRQGQGHRLSTPPARCRAGWGNDKADSVRIGVIRGEPGNAEVHVTPPGGLTRVLTFMGHIHHQPGEKVGP